MVKCTSHWKHTRIGFEASCSAVTVNHDINAIISSAKEFQMFPTESSKLVYAKFKLCKLSKSLKEVRHSFCGVHLLR